MRWDVLSEFSSKEGLIDKLLENRGLVSEEDKDRFLNPPKVAEFLAVFDEEFRTAVEIAAKKITTNMSVGRPIVIHGDYDADGICATAILYRTIHDELDYQNVGAFIPSRFEHGYGLSIASVDAIKAEMKDVSNALLVTVDTGITSNEAVDYAKSLGFEVIIADHHQKPDVLPAADVIVWNEEMVGSGIAWILAHALGARDERLLGLAALATVTDLQPLFGFNRSMVREGLQVLNTNPFPGIKALYGVSGRKGPMGTYELGWVLGPRLNATGRIGSANEAFSLLTEDNNEEVKKFAVTLNQMNVERQDKTLEMYDLANSLQEGEKPRIIVSVSADYHEGIIGLVAAKLVQEHHRPAVVVSLDGELGKGSVRSVSGVDIVSFLRKFEDLFENVGGHPMAAGFTIKASRVGELIENIERHSADYVLDEHLVPLLKIDASIPLDLVDMDFAESLESLKPFGMGNREPVFMSHEVGLVGFDIVGKGREHISLKLLAGGKIYKGIWFGGVEKAPELSLGQRLDIVYSVEKKEYDGRVYLDLIVKDIKVL